MFKAKNQSEVRMKVIIAGSRTIQDFNVVKKAIEESKFEIKEVISGGARGVDTLAIRWAKENKIPYKVFPADWEKYGRSAGAIRNRQMAKRADAVIAIWNRLSKGTGDMIKVANVKGLHLFVFVLDDDARK